MGEHKLPKPPMLTAEERGAKVEGYLAQLKAVVAATMDAGEDEADCLLQAVGIFYGDVLACLPSDTERKALAMVAERSFRHTVERLLAGSRIIVPGGSLESH